MEVSICKRIAKNIISSVDFNDIYKELTECEPLKGKLEIHDSVIKVTINIDFIIECLGGRKYINGKFYHEDDEDEDLLGFICKMVSDSETIYVQYKHRHLSFNSKHLFGYFKEIKRNKYCNKKLKHKKDIEKIFDVNGLIGGSCK